MTQRIRWTAEMASQLRALWLTGISCTAIGRAMGISVGAVTGKARRMGLPPRPSPIKTVGKRAIRVQDYMRRKSSQEAVQAIVAVKATCIAQEAVKPSRGRVEPCCWVDGVKGSWKYCDAPSVAGRVYCRAHCDVAYIEG